ncbi:MAG: hypothetical protein U0516_01725 [Candidatus Saccharibacteria bacterium]
MPTAAELQLNRELLADAKDHTCEMKPEWMLITHQNGAGVLWDNSFGDPQELRPPLTPLVLGALYCPFCGKRFGEMNEVTSKVGDIILTCFDNLSSEFREMYCQIFAKFSPTLSMVFKLPSLFQPKNSV